jgi:hypothetical protein
MTNDLAAEINKRLKRSLSKDPNVLTCIVTGKSRPTNSAYLDEKAKVAGSKERFIDNYICREALTLLKKGKTLSEVRTELNVTESLPIIPQSTLDEALQINGK